MSEARRIVARVDNAERQQRFDRALAKVRAMRHAWMAYESSESDFVRESALQACLNAGREFSWVAKAQLQRVIGEDDWPAAWADASTYLRSDLVSSFLYDLRNRATHEGLLEVRHLPFTTTPARFSIGEWLEKRRAKGAVTLPLYSFPVLPDAPSPYDEWPVLPLLQHWTNLTYEAAWRLYRHVNPDARHRVPRFDGSVSVLTLDELLAELREDFQRGPLLPVVELPSGLAGRVVGQVTRRVSASIRALRGPNQMLPIDGETAAHWMAPGELEALGWTRMRDRVAQESDSDPIP